MKDQKDYNQILATNSENNPNPRNQSKSKRIFKLVVGIFTILSILGIVIVVILLNRKKNQVIKSPEKPIDIIGLQLPNLDSFKILEGTGFIASSPKIINRFIKYHSKKNVQMEIKIADELHIRNETINTDFVLNIYDKQILENGEEQFKANFIILNLTRIHNEELQNFGGLNIFNISESEEEKIYSDEDMEDIDKYINSIPLLKFTFFRNGSIFDLYTPINIHGFIEYVAIDIIQNLIPQINQENYLNFNKENKNNNIHLMKGREPGNQKLYEFDGKFTNLYKHECKGVMKGKLEFEGSRMNSDTKIRINNEFGNVESIKMTGEALFVSETEENKMKNPNLQNNQEGKIYGEYESKSEFEHSKDNIVENQLKSIGDSFTFEIKLIQIIEKNETISKSIEELSKRMIMNYEHDYLSEESEELRILNQLNIPKIPYPRNLKKIPVITSKTQLRNLKIERLDEPVVFQYCIFKFNFVGVQMKLNAVVEANPKTSNLTISGVVEVGSFQYTIADYTTNSSLGKAIARTLLAVNYTIDYIQNITGDVDSNTTNWMNIVADALNNIIPIVDPSAKEGVGDTFIESVNKFLDKVKNKTESFFSTISSGIEKANTFLDNIKGDVESANLTEVRLILSEIASQYYTFIANMEEMLDGFHNTSLGLIESMISLSESANNFTIDGLYELKEKMNKVKTMYSTFINKLFTCIPEGIANYHKKAEEAALGVLQKPLEFIQFIENALRNNFIMQLIAHEDVRIDLANKLKTFSIRSTALITVIIDKSNDTFQEAVIEGKGTTIKYDLTEKVNNMLAQFDSKQEILVEKIKSKIEAFKKFEQYNLNVDEIEDVQNGVQEKIFNAYEDNFVETVTKKNFDFDFYNSDIIKDNISKAADTLIKQVNNEMSTIQSRIKGAMYGLKCQYFTQLSSLVKDYSENLKDGTIGEFLENFNNSIDLMETVNEDKIKSNYEKAIEYIDELLQYKQKMTRPGVTNGYYTKFSVFTETGGEFFDLLHDESEPIVENKITESINAIRKNLTKIDIKIPDELFEYSDMAFLQPMIDQVNQEIEEALEYLDDPNYFSDYTMKYYEDTFVTPLNNLNHDKTQEIIDLKAPLDNLSVADGEETDICELTQKCEKQGGKKECWDEADCIKTPKSNNYKYLIKEGNYAAITIQVDEYLENCLNNLTNQRNDIINMFNKIISQAQRFIKEYSEESQIFLNNVNTFKTAVESAIESGMETELLTNIFREYSEGLNTKIDNYFNSVTNQFDNFKNEYYEKVLNKTLNDLVQKPDELIEKFNQLKFMYSSGTKLNENLEAFLLGDINTEIKNQFSNIEDYIAQILDKIAEDVPDELKEAFQDRIQILQNMYEEIKVFFDQKIAYLTVKENQAKIIGSDPNDIFRIKQIVNSKESIITNKINQVSELVTAKVNSYVDPHISYKQNEYQLTKIMETSEFFKQITQTIIQMVNNKDFDMTNLVNGYIKKFSLSINNNLGRIRSQIKNKIKDFQNDAFKELRPIITDITNELYDDLEEMVNFTLVNENLNPILDQMDNITYILKYNIQEIAHKFASTVYNLLYRELHAEWDRGPYNLNKEYYKEVIETIIRTSSHRTYRELYNSFSFLQINLNVINPLLNQFKTNILTPIFNEIKKVLNEITSDYTYELFGKKMNVKVYIDNVISESMTNIEQAMDARLATIIGVQMRTVRRLFKNESENIENAIYDFMHDQFMNNLYNPLVNKSNSSATRYLNQPSYEAQVLFTNTILGEIKPYFLSLNYSNEVYKFYQQKLGQIVFSQDIMVVNYDLITAEINGLSTDLELMFKTKISLGELEFQSSVQQIYEDGLKEVIKAFGTNFGPNYNEKIYRMIISNGIDDMIKFLENKIQAQYETIGGLLKTPSDMTQTMKVILNDIFPNLVEELGTKVNKKIGNYLAEFIQDLKIASGEQIVEVYKSIINDNETYLNDPNLNLEIAQLIQDGINEQIYENFQQIAETSLESFSLSEMTKELQDKVNIRIEGVISPLEKKKSQIQLSTQGIPATNIDQKVQNVLNKLLDYKSLVETKLQEIIFNLDNNVFNKFKDFYTNQITPIINTVTDIYSKYETIVQEAVNEVVSVFNGAIEALKSKLETTKLVEMIRKLKDNILDLLNFVKKWIQEKMAAFKKYLEDHLFKKNTSENYIINEQLLKQFLNDNNNYRKYKNLHQQKEDMKNSLELDRRQEIDEKNTVVDFSVIKKIITKFKKYIDVFIKFVRKLKEIGSLKNLIAKFKIFMKDGIKKLRAPIDDAIKKIKDLVSKENLNKILEQLLYWLLEAQQVSENHEKAVSSNSTEFHEITSKDLIEVFSGLKGTTGEKILQILEAIYNLVVADVQPIHLVKPVDPKGHNIPIFSYVLPIYGIPFKFSLDFNYNYNYGIDLSLQNSSIAINASLGAEANLVASASISIAIIEFGAKITGLLGKGTVGIGPIFNIFKFKIALDAYFKLEAFRLQFEVYLTIPWVELEAVQISIFGIFKVTIYIPHLTSKTFEYGFSTKTGVEIEKHYKKDL